MFFSKLFQREEMTTGMIPDLLQESDPRNIYYEDIAPMGGIEVPESGDVEKGDWTLNQGRTASCTAHSTVYCVNQATGWRLSPRYAFNKIKTDPKYPSSQLGWGAFMTDSVKLMANEGIAEYKECPNEMTTSDAEYINFTPTEPMEASARRHKGGSYIFVTGGTDQLKKFDDVVRYLHEQKRPVKIGMDWRTSFNNARKGGVVPAELASGKVSGHDMAAVAWKRINGHEYLGFRASFGATWGDKGRIWLPKGFFKIGSAPAYLPPAITAAIGIIKPEPVEAWKRDVHLEKHYADMLRKMFAAKYPIGEHIVPSSRTLNMEARGLAGRMWLLLVQAVTYRKWTVKDVENFLWAKSRNLSEERAYYLDFNLIKGK